MGPLTKVILSLSAFAGSVLSQGTFAVTGVSGNVGPRLELRQFQQDPVRWNLYLLAMNDYRWMPQDQRLSYYQIGGIHGVPNIPWDGVQGNPNNGAVGYCPHVSPIFPPWHRAYVALFEQAFLERVRVIANSFPASQRQQYVNAANSMRVPYWDWAAAPPAGQPVMPASITDKYVTVNTPTGRQNWINPLFRFDTHPLDHAGFLQDPWDNWPVTLRYPNSSDPVNVHSQNEQAVSRINSDNPSLRNRIYQLFSTCTDFRGFGNSASDARTSSCQDSLESIHNNIHNDVGGNNGHMTILWYAAFDPSFWLHHANVDRLFALWQAINPNSYSLDATTQQPTYAIPRGTRANANTGLAPFHRDSNGNLHTANTVRRVESLGYTYPELQGDNSPQAVRRKFNALYGNGAGQSRKRDVQSYPDKNSASSSSNGAASVVSKMAGTTPAASPWVAPASAKNPPMSPAAGYRPLNLPSNDSALLTPTHHSNIEYNTNVACEGFSLGGSYSVYVFLGAPSSENPSTWGTDENLCGTHSTFSSPAMHSRTLVSGNVPLTQTLISKLAKGEISSLKREDTIPYMTKNLEWRAMKSDGTVISNHQVPGLAVGVQSAPVKAAKSDSDFPTYGGWSDHHEVTHGKAGGIQQGMQSDWYNHCVPV